MPHVRASALGQIHSALTYYWDHREELEADMERRFQEVKELRFSAEASPLQQKLRRLRHSG